MAKFEVGARVRCTFVDNEVPGGALGTVLDSSMCPYVEWDEPVREGHDANGLGHLGYCWAISEDWLQLVGHDYSKKVNKESNMSIVNKVRELARSKDDKLLIKHDVINPEGPLTKYGQDLVLDYLFEQNKAAIVAKVEAVDKAEKAEKK